MPAKSLAALQTDFARAIRRISPLDRDATIDAAAVNLVVDAGPCGMTSVERLDIYREQFWFRHWASLAEDFPTVSALLGGRGKFDRLATDYLTAVPPRTWNLQRLGEGLPGFVASSQPWHDDPAIADAARLDWAFVRAFDAPEAAPFDMRLLAAAPAEAVARAGLGFHPALTVTELRHGVHETRRALHRQEAPPRPVARTSFVAVWRDQGNHLRDADVEQEEFALWEALSAGRSLGEACEYVARDLVPEAAAALNDKVGRWFQQWAARGWITDVRLHGEPALTESSRGGGES
jgi:hypothetical protein